jgi:hypothetical protein
VNVSMLLVLDLSGLDRRMPMVWLRGVAGGNRRGSDGERMFSDNPTYRKTGAKTTIFIGSFMLMVIALIENIKGISRL